MPVVINGSLQTIIGGHPEVGSVEVALCGYGSQIPRLNATGLAARVTDYSVDVASNGTFTFDVSGNDLIAPDGTYYTVTIKDDNGDVVQVNAYQFLSTQPSYDLDDTDPFDPSQTPPAKLPYLVLDLLLVVDYDPAAVFPGDDYTAWQITLTGDIANPHFMPLVDGNLYTIIIIQDDAGGHAFDWPPSVNNATSVNQDPNGITIQTFVAVNGNLYAIGAGTYWP
jgi:hypothetical protein